MAKRTKTKKALERDFEMAKAENRGEVEPEAGGHWQHLVDGARSEIAAYQRKCKRRFPTLDALMEAMKLNHPLTMDGKCWSCDLPTYGGEEPVDTLGVWSWDKTRLLVGACSDDLEIVPRLK